MPSVDFVVESEVSASARARQLEGMFDVPRCEVQRLEWHHELPFDEQPWNVGLIVGPSGCGKTLLARELWGDRLDWAPSWDGAAVIDDFAAELSIADIASVCQSVGFNTIPAWLRPYRVLSNGEQFRADIARRLLEQDDPIVVDEFTSVVDRQVGKIGAHAVQKYIRLHNRKFVAVTCHHDVIDWLQPDWVFSPAEGSFVRRSLQQRPAVDGVIRRVHRRLWRLFARHHYLTNELHASARCYALFVDEQPVSFVALLYRPHPVAKNIYGVSRGVTLPDWQGMGLIRALSDTVASAHRTVGHRVRAYPGHPGHARSLDRSSCWSLAKRPGVFGYPRGRRAKANLGRRSSAVFEYVGPAMATARGALALLDGEEPQAPPD